MSEPVEKLKNCLTVEGVRAHLERVFLSLCVFVLFVVVELREREKEKYKTLEKNSFYAKLSKMSFAHSGSTHEPQRYSLSPDASDFFFSIPQDQHESETRPV